MKPGDNIFVYGTLKAGHGAHDYLVGRSKFVGDSRISGRMYGLGGFPGVKVESEEFISEGPTVKGEIYHIDDDTLPRMLDRYEGYPFLYDRKQVKTESGETVWVYEYNDNPDEKQLIPTGNWE